MMIVVVVVASGDRDHDAGCLVEYHLARAAFIAAVEGRAFPASAARSSVIKEPDRWAGRDEGGDGGRERGPPRRTRCAQGGNHGM